jgi:hypothetical protein
MSIIQWWVVTVGGVDITEYVSYGSLSINNAAGGRTSAQFTLTVRRPNDSTIPDPAQWAQVEIRHTVSGSANSPLDDILVFGGVVDTVEDTLHGGTTGYRTRLVRCLGYGSLLDRAVVGAVWESTGAASPASDGFGTVESIFEELVDIHFAELPVPPTYDGHSVTPNAVGTIVSNWERGGDISRRICEAAGCDYYVDHEAAIQLISEGTGTGPAPFSIEQNDGNWRSLTAIRTNTKFWNHAIARSTKNVEPVREDTFTGDGSTSSFGYALPLLIGAQQGHTATLPTNTVYVNGVPMVIVDDYTQGRTSISFGTPPANAANITVQGTLAIDPVKEAEDATSITAVGRVSYVRQIQDIPDGTTLQDIADALLEEGLDTTPDLIITTARPGLEPGQALVVDANDVDATVLITQVDWADATPNTPPICTVRTSGRPKRKITGAELFSNLNQKANAAIDRASDGIKFKLAETIVGLDNPGVVAGLEVGAVAVAHKNGPLRRALMYFKTGDGPVKIDVLQNGVSIFADGGITWGGSGVVQSYNFASNPHNVRIGDVFTLDIVTEDETATDGFLVIEQMG